MAEIPNIEHYMEVYMKPCKEAIDVYLETMKRGANIKICEELFMDTVSKWSGKQKMVAFYIYENEGYSYFSRLLFANETALCDVSGINNIMFEMNEIKKH